jgi:phosphate/phosphite/phosphonate ABC transporter binding protein
VDTRDENGGSKATTLARWLETPRSWRDIVEHFVAAGRSLVAAHAAGRPHGEFTPANVVLGEDGRVELVGGGGNQTAAPGYMAPELLAGGPVAPETDQYAIAACLRGAIGRSRDKHPGAIDQITGRGIAHAPGERYPSVSALLADLERVLYPDRERTLAFGFPPTGSQSTKRDEAADLVRLLGERAGLQLRAVFADHYRALVEDLLAGRVDVAWLGPIAALRAGAGAVPVLVMQRAERTTYHATLIARRDAGIASVADLGGKRIGWVDEDSAAGYVIPRALIAAHRADVDAYLGEQRVLGSHRAVVEAVLNGSVDAGATFVNFDEDGEVAVASWFEHFGERRDEIVGFEVSSPIPHDMIAVRASLPADDRAAVIAALRALANDHEGQDLQMAVFNGAQRFGSVDPGLLADLALLVGRTGWKPR